MRIYIKKQVRGVYMGFAMMGFLHVYMKYTQPLFVQALMGLKSLCDAKTVAIHILGKPDTDTLVSNRLWRSTFSSSILHATVGSKFLQFTTHKPFPYIWILAIDQFRLPRVNSGKHTGPIISEASS